MNLPRRVTIEVSSSVCVICGSVTDVEKGFANNGDD
jgi:hypothetical protein